MAKKLTVVTPTIAAPSRFTATTERYLAEYVRLTKERAVALEHGEHQEAFVLLLQLEDYEDRLRQAYRRDTFWRQA